MLSSVVRKRQRCTPRRDAIITSIVYYIARTAIYFRIGVIFYPIVVCSKTNGIIHAVAGAVPLQLIEIRCRPPAAGADVQQYHHAARPSSSFRLNFCSCTVYYYTPPADASKTDFPSSRVERQRQHRLCVLNQFFRTPILCTYIQTIL